VLAESMKQFKEALGVLKKSKEFKDWKKQNPKSYLSYAFFIVEDNESNWKIGYYHKKHEKVVSFDVGDKIKIEPEQEVLQKKKKVVEKIDLAKVKHDFSDAVTIAVNTQQEEYATESPKKIFAILQTLDKKQVWNITFLTQSYNTLNFKIKSDNLKIVEKKLQPLFQFDKGGISGMEAKK
jgi:DNA polymerase III alpha subunit